MAEVQEAYYAGDFAEAKSAAVGIVDVVDGDYRPTQSGFDASSAALIDLEMAVVELASGRPASAIERADLASRKYQAMLEKYVGANFLVTLRNELLSKQLIANLGGDLTRTRYIGNDWEHVMSRVLIALSALAQGDLEGAKGIGNEVGDLCQGWLEAWQAESRALEEGDSGKRPSADEFLMTGIGFLVQGVVVEAQSKQPGRAEPEYEQALKFEQRTIDKTGPLFDLDAGIGAQLQRAQQGRLSSAKTGRVWVFCLTDELVWLVPHQLRGSAAIENAINITLQVAGVRRGTQAPAIKNLEIGLPQARAPELGSVGLEVDGEPWPLRVVTDLQPVVKASYDRTKFGRIIRAVALRLAKDGLAEAAKAIADGNRSEEQFVRFLAEGLQLLWSTAERPDTRSWRLLPRRVRLARLELPPGRHRLSIRATDVDHESRARATERSIDLDVRAGQDSFVVTMLPNASTPTAIFWATETGEAWVVPPGASERVEVHDRGLAPRHDRDLGQITDQTRRLGDSGVGFLFPPGSSR